MKTFEDAMVDVANSTDGAGKAVILYHGNWSADSLREATRNFARHVVPAEGNGPLPEVLFYAGFNNSPSSDAEVVYWENLAKLAIATAAAIREGR